MAFQKYATENDICNHFCPYKIGDKVTLTSILKTENGFFERGTVMEILAVSIRKELKIRTVRYEQINSRCADMGIFEFELIDPETSVKVKATADYWGERLINKKRMTKMLLQIWILPFIAGIIPLVLLPVNSDNATAACVVFVFVFFCAISCTSKLVKKLHPNIWESSSRRSKNDRI